MQIVIQLCLSLSLLGFIINLILGYVSLSHGNFVIFHLVVGLASTFLGVSGTMLSTSYFLGIRDQLTEEDKLSKMDSQVLSEAKMIKKALFSSCGMAMTLILLHTIVGACVFIRIIPALPHHVLAYIVVMAQAKALRATLAFHRFQKKLPHLGYTAS
ncbi:MAG: hypothetical protein HYS08_08735 [Chlamydiae bacterium]|nr:hypothetical protein [Chlamydiota bacterium]MBI3265448.1 hypothetical protein [Chlamydiota bacterium]